jgi:hypothetical protein
MLLFRSEEHVARWCRMWNRPRGAVFSLQQGLRLAEVWYGNRLSPSWRPFSVDQAQAALSSVGLRSSFWQLQKS